jgi:hypothetical protein
MRDQNPWRVCPGGGRKDGDCMSLAIVDARGWQNLFDLRTGKKTEDNRSQTWMLRGILKDHPYPGDVDFMSNRWVTDTALDLIGAYQPQLACVVYAHQYFAARYTPMSETQRKTMLETVFAEVERLTMESGFTPVIIGSGDMVQLAGEIDVTKVDGIAISSHWSARYAGLHRASSRDLDYVRSHAAIERVVRREEWIDLFPGTSYRADRIPEYLLVAREGWSFATTGTPIRKSLQIPGQSFHIPFSAPFGTAATVTDVRSLIHEHLNDKKIAFIIIEGVGLRDFRMACTPCGNRVGWHYYEPGDSLYLTLSTGTHQVFVHPSGYQYLDEIHAKRDFPFSGYFLDIPEHTLASNFPSKSIAVGNHSMFVHMIFGADICVECFARNLYNQGCLGVIHNFK